MVQVGISKNCYHWKFILFNTNPSFVKLKGSSFIPLPDVLMRKNAMINLKNRNDENCFMWSVLRNIRNCKDKHSDEIRDVKQYENDLNFKRIDFPVQTKDIKKFEQQNPNLPGINVFSINHQNKIDPLRLNDLDCQIESKFN